MVENKLITLGCSLTHQNGWKERTALLTNRTLVNFAQGAGSNGLQINRLHEYIINNSIEENDIVIWQITASGRMPLRLNPDQQLLKEIIEIDETQFIPIDNTHYVKTVPNLFDGIPRIDILCNSPIINRPQVLEFDPRQELQTLVSTLILLSKSHKKLLIFFGWSNILPEKYKSIFANILRKHEINYIDNPYVDWARSNNKTFRDDTHPSQLAGEQFTDEVILPKLSELGWIT